MLEHLFMVVVLYKQLTNSSYNIHENELDCNTMFGYVYLPNAIFDPVGVYLLSFAFFLNFQLVIIKQVLRDLHYQLVK